MRRSASTSLAAVCGVCAALGVVVAAGRQAHRARTRPHALDEGDRAQRHTPSDDRRRNRQAPRDPARHREHALRERADALSRRKQDFLGLLSHELRNPLSAIQVALAVMRARPNIDAGQQARSVVERQVAHIARLVDDLVDSARIERGTLSLHLEPLDLRDVLRTAVEMAHPSVADRQQTFVWTSSEEQMEVSGDRVRLQQVFSNLLINASKYTPAGGVIEVVTYREGSDFCVAVRDNGMGIAAEDIDKVFEPFVRASRNTPGLGVGLYVARTLVEQHGGEITVTSVGRNQGATFTVRIPELSPLFREAGETSPSGESLVNARAR